MKFSSLKLDEAVLLFKQSISQIQLYRLDHMGRCQQAMEIEKKYFWKTSKPCLTNYQVFSFSF